MFPQSRQTSVSHAYTSGIHLPHHNQPAASTQSGGTRVWQHKTGACNTASQRRHGYAWCSSSKQQHAGLGIGSTAHCGHHIQLGVE